MTTLRYSKKQSAGRLNRAFTLIEIALALGVTAFALVAIMGMIPVAVDAARESKRESRAAFIAQGIISSMRGTPFTESRPIVPNAPVLNLGATATEYLAFGLDGQSLGGISAAQYNTGIANAGPGPNNSVEFVARIVATPQPQPLPSPAPVNNRLSKVEVRLETPAVAATANRSNYVFVTLIGE